AAASDAVRTQIVEELASLTERLRTPPDADALGDAVTGRAAQAATASPDRPPAAMPDGIPHRVRAAVAGRPCRLPPGVDPDSPAAALSLLQVPGLRLLVDGYNVTKDTRGMPTASLEDQRAWLLQVVAGALARFDVRPILVFDGRPDVETAPRRARGVIVQFTAEETADEMIVNL